MSQKKKGLSSSLDAESLANLRLSLQAGDAPDLTDSTFEALAEDFSRSDPETARSGLQSLQPLASSSARLKALKRAAYRLGQRGIDVTDLAFEAKPRGIRIAEADPSGGLPVLMAPPDVNSVRTLNFPLTRGPAVVAIEAVIKPRQLFRLKASPAHRDGYRRWANIKLQSGDGGQPERVRLSLPWLERKLWEIADLYHKNQTGPEVDRGLVEAFTLPETEPPHPARDLEIAGEPSPWSMLGQRPDRARPIYQGSALAALRSKWYEAGGGPDLEPSTELLQAMHRAVGEWIDQWGRERITELMLDATLFFHAIGDTDAARAYVHAAAPLDPEERGARIHAFLDDFAIWQLSQH